MKKLFLTLALALAATFSFAGSILIEGFEYANHDFVKPVGWTCDDNSWLCGHLEKDHNRIPHSGNWYAFTGEDEAWMFMPLYFIGGMRYRISTWAVTDGQFSLSICTGSAPDPSAMSHVFSSETIDNQEYIRYSTYIDNVPAGCDYIGIHAVRLQGEGFLTIDDIEVDMVEQYTFEAEAITGDTAMYPGTEAVFRFLIHNTGYDPVSITMNPSNEFFTNTSFYAKGSSGITFPTEPDEIVEVTAYTTLRPEIEPGTVAWLDIHMTIPCNCNTALVTFWVTPLDITQVSENQTNVSVYPNPATDLITVEAEGLKQVDVVDMTGKTLNSVAAEGDSMLLNVSDLNPGTYFIVAKTRSTSSFVKPILKM